MAWPRGRGAPRLTPDSPHEDPMPAVAGRGSSRDPEGAASSRLLHIYLAWIVQFVMRRHVTRRIDVSREAKSEILRELGGSEKPRSRWAGQTPPHVRRPAGLLPQGNPHAPASQPADLVCYLSARGRRKARPCAGETRPARVCPRDAHGVPRRPGAAHGASRSPGPLRRCTRRPAGTHRRSSPSDLRILRSPMRARQRPGGRATTVPSAIWRVRDVAAADRRP